MTDNIELPSGDEMAATLLRDTADLVNDDRDTHGDAVVNQQHIAQGWTWYLRGLGVLGPDESLAGDDVGAMMSVVKMSRHSTGEKDIDHMRDIAGYGGIGGACLVADGEADVEQIARGAYEVAHLDSEGDETEREQMERAIDALVERFAELDATGELSDYEVEWGDDC